MAIALVAVMPLGGAIGRSRFGERMEPVCSAAATALSSRPGRFSSVEE